MSIQRVCLISALLVVETCGSRGLLAESVGPVAFNRDIRPILSRHCFKCHGPDEDERMGGQDDGLRLDTRGGALEDLGGYAAIVPGNPEESALVARIKSHDEDEQMPPSDSAEKLNDDEIELIVRWIREGGSYAQHWSYAMPTRPPMPEVKDIQWPKNPVDRFILSRLEREGLKPSPEANRHGVSP